MDRQVAVTAEAHDLHVFENWLHWLAFGISLFVLALIVYVIFKFNEKSNPTPSRTTHNTMIEVAWTIIPVLILVAVAIPSFRTLRTQLSDPKADVLVKVIGHAWYWSYEYPTTEGDKGGFTFDANLDDEKQPKLLATDNNDMVVPVGKIVKVQVTSGDVIHSWAMPSFGGQDRRDPRPSEPVVVQGRPRGHLSRPVLRAVRCPPRLHADHRARRLRAGLRRVADRGEDQVRCDRQRLAPRGRPLTLSSGRGDAPAET